MREFLEDAAEHVGDGASRARANQKRPLPKRFYSDVSMEMADGGYLLKLDGRTAKTPAKTPIWVRGTRLANSIKAEWSSQEEHIDPSKMPLTRMISVELDGVEDAGAAIVADICKFAGGDLLFYRADHPDGLIAAQDAVWGPVLDQLTEAYGWEFTLTRGIAHAPQPQATLAGIKNILIPLSVYSKIGLHTQTTLLGSAFLAISVYLELLLPEEVWNAAHVDENWNILNWGSDPEAEALRAHKKREFDAAQCLLDMVKQDAPSQ